MSCNNNTTASSSSAVPEYRAVSAETEKYAHVTFFFNGGREAQFEGENRILVPSPKVATYDLQPEMSAPEVADKLVEQLNQKAADFVCLNFANGDMVGHTGVYEATGRPSLVTCTIGLINSSVIPSSYDFFIAASTCCVCGQPCRFEAVAYCRNGKICPRDLFL